MSRRTAQPRATGGGGFGRRPPAVNRPEVVEEITTVFADYERALAHHDVAALAEAFWASDLTVRYGIAECLYGAAEIDTWRRAAPPVPAGRRLGPTTVATFGDDVACVSTEFRYDGDPLIGRQSQTWLRLPEGWRIVSAHVSQVPSA